MYLSFWILFTSSKKSRFKIPWKQLATYVQPLSKHKYVHIATLSIIMHIMLQLNRGLRKWSTNHPLADEQCWTSGLLCILGSSCWLGSIFLSKLLIRYRFLNFTSFTVTTNLKKAEWTSKMLYYIYSIMPCYWQSLQTTYALYERKFQHSKCI